MREKCPFKKETNLPDSTEKEEVLIQEERTKSFQGLKNSF